MIGPTDLFHPSPAYILYTIHISGHHWTCRPEPVQ